MIYDILHIYRDIHPDTSHGPQFDLKFWIALHPQSLDAWVPMGPRKWQFSVQLGHGGSSLDVRSCGALISASAAKSGGRITMKKA
jgi:hypothetical protein